MKALMKLLSPVPLATICAVLLIGLAAWAGFKMSAPLILVLAIVFAVIVIYVLVLFILKMRADKAGQALEKSIDDQAQKQLASSRPGREKDIAQLRGQLVEAIGALKASRVGKGKKGASALYVLPWYMIIGPPAAGKTTLLQNSGLNFPYLDPDRSRSSVRGVGGTRNCDWWFADEAVILDTAGRYVMPVEADDTQEWLAFLDLLRKYRGRKPINGLIVGVSIQDLIAGSEEELENHALKIRGRIDELIKQLGITFPVYVVFTKCDLIRGFIEFFGDLSRNERAQAWGATVARERAAAGQAQVIFEEEMDHLADSLLSAKNQRLAQVTQPESRPDVLFFPLQFSALRPRLSRFVETLFRANPYQELPIFRGFYFTSGTQEGRPIDQVINAMLKGFGVEGGTEGMYVEPSQTKSYFIEDVFSKVAFPDRHLAGPSAQGEKRRRALRLRTFSVGAVFAFLFLILMMTLYNVNHALIAQMRSLADRASSSIHVGTGVLGLDDLRTLDQLRQKLMKMDDRGRAWKKAAFLGTYQGDEAADAGRRAHFRVLADASFSPAVPFLADHLRKEADTGNDFRRYYCLYRTWRMLQDPSSLLSNTADADVAAGPLTESWMASTGSRDGLEEYQRLMKLQLEYAGGRQKILAEVFQKADPAVDEIARAKLRRDWTVEKVYPGLTRAASPMPPITVGTFVSSDLGLAGPAQVPASFTKDGWPAAKAYLDWVNAAPQDWALRAAWATDPPALRSDLAVKYADEYERQWLDFLRSTQVLAGAGDAAAQVFLERASTDNSPILKLLRGVADNTGLGKEADRELALVAEDFGIVREFLGAGKGAWPMKYLKGFGSGKKSPAAEYLEQVRALKEAYAAIAKSPTPGQEKQVLDLEGWVSTHVPTETPVGAELARLLLLPNAAVSKQAPMRRTGQIAGNWGDVQGEFQNLASSYPFAAGASSEAALKDFESFFGVNGTFWTFYNTSLKGIVSQDGSRELDPSIHLSPEFRTFLRKAWGIRNAFFSNGDKAGFSVSLRPSIPARPPDSKVVFHSSRLEIGGKALVYSAGQPKPVQVSWPGDEPMSGASLSLNLGSSATAEDLTAPGLWGFFRLLDRAKVAPGAGTTTISWTVNTDKGNLQVQYDALGLSANNPLDPGLLRLTCPQRIEARPE